jgi:hypothetical protein
MSRHRYSSVKGNARLATDDFRRLPQSPLVKPPPRPSLLYNRTVDKRLILLLPALSFLYCSWRPVFSLRAEMPPQFVDVSAGATPVARAREQRLALAYWDVARTVIRWKYTYGASLPNDPPPEFAVSEEGITRPGAPSKPDSKRAGNPRPAVQGARTAASGSRLRYWRKLQEVWTEPYAWKARRQWSTAWFTGPIRRVRANFQDWCRNLIRTS